MKTFKFTNKVTSRFYSILRWEVFCIVLSLFVSCENFLNGQDVKEQIEEAIAYNNAMSSTLIFRAANNEVDFLTGNEKICRLGYTVDIQFSVNSNDYKFHNLEAVSLIDKTESRADYVEFTDIGTDTEKNNGIYKIRIKLLKQADDILIRPVCVLIPRVKQITPAYSKDGYQQDTSITIEFNKAINTQTFDPNCISIKNGEEELFSTNPALSYFEAPQFSCDNTILTIPTVKGKYIIPRSPAGQKQKDITVSIISSDIKDIDGFTLQPVEPHTYRINQSVDNEKPEVKTISAANTSDTTNWFYRTLTDKSIDNWSSETEYGTDGTTVKFLNGDYSRNHIIDTLQITLQGYDKDSGIKAVKVREVFEKTSGGVDTMKTETEKIFGTGQFVYVPDSDNVYEYSFNYKFAASANDGLYKLEISVIDKAENESEPVSYYVIKDTDLKRRLYWYGYLDVPYSFKGPYDVPITDNCYPQYNETTGKYESKFIFHYFNFFEDNFYSSYKTLCKKLLIQLCNSNNEYVTIYEDNNLSNQDIADVSTSYGVVNTQNIITPKINEIVKKLIIDPDTTTNFKVILYEENGTINEYPFAIAKRPRICAHKQDGANAFKFIEEEMDYSISSDISVYLSSEYGIVGKMKDGESEISSFKRLSTIYDECCDEDNCTYYISYARVAMNGSGRIYSAYGKPYVLYRKQGTNMNNFMTYICSPSQIADFEFPDFSFPVLNDANIANGKIEFPPNSGKVRFYVDITYPDDEYEYLFKISNDGRIEGFSSTNRLEINNGEVYKISLLARNSDGIIVAESEAKKIKYTGIDNIPPTLDTGGLWYYKDHLEINRYSVKDKDGSFTESVDSLGNPYEYLNEKFDRVKSMDYYFVPFNLGNNVTREELENANYTKYTLNVSEYNPDANMPRMIIPLYFLEQGNFYIYCYLEDIAGNSALYAYPSYKTIGCYTVPILPEYNEKKTVTTYDYADWCEEDEGCEKKDLFSITIPKYSDAIKPASDAYDGTHEYYAFLYSKFDSTSNKWQEYTGDEMSWEMLPALLKKTDETFTFTVTSQNDESVISKMVNKFYKIEAQYGYGSGGNQLPVYLSPIYVFRGSDNYDYTCRNKNIMNAYNGYQIFCDKPVFVHTMYSKFKFTETYSAEDSHIWEGRAAETGIVYSDGSANTFSYTEDELTDIPDGCYYTTIFHFVDGTTVMTPVKQK